MDGFDAEDRGFGSVRPRPNHTCSLQESTWAAVTFHLSSVAFNNNELVTVAAFLHSWLTDLPCLRGQERRASLVARSRAGLSTVSALQAFLIVE